MSLNTNTTTLAADASDEAKQLRVYVQQAAQVALDTAESSSDDQDSVGSLIYLGNPQTAIPDRLLMSKDLDSDQKIIWSLMRMQVQHPSRPAATPRQSDLADMLTVSRVTVMTKIMGLRIYRWLTRCAVIKSQSSGLYHGVIDAIHDQPLPLPDTLYLDPDYIAWLEELTRRHSSNYKQVRDTARVMLNKIDSGDLTDGLCGNNNDMFYGVGDEYKFRSKTQEPNQAKPKVIHDQKLIMDKNTKTNRDQKLITVKTDQNHPCSKIDHGQNSKIIHAQKLIMDKNTEKPSNQPTIGIYINKLLRSSSCSNKYITTTTTTSEVKCLEENQASGKIGSANFAQRSEDGNQASGKIGSANFAQRPEDGNQASGKIGSANFAQRPEDGNQASGKIGSANFAQRPEDGAKTVEFNQSSTSSLCFPKCLTQSEQTLAVRVLRKLPGSDQQYLLDYLRDRVADQTAKPIENRLGYLGYLARELKAGTLEPASYGIKRQESPSVSTQAKEPSATEAQAAWERQMRQMMGEDAEAHIAKARRAAGLDE